MVDYDGDEMLRYTKINLKRDTDGINIAYL